MKAQMVLLEKPAITKRYTVIIPKKRTFMVDPNKRGGCFVRWTTDLEEANSWRDPKEDDTVVDADQFVKNPNKMFRNKYAWLSHVPGY